MWVGGWMSGINNTSDNVSIDPWSTCASKQAIECGWVGE